MLFSFAVVVLKTHVLKKKTVFTFTLLLAENFWNDGYGLIFAPDIENNNTRNSYKLAGEKISDGIT